MFKLVIIRSQLLENCRPLACCNGTVLMCNGTEYKLVENGWVAEDSSHTDKIKNETNEDFNLRNININSCRLRVKFDII